MPGRVWMIVTVFFEVDSNHTIQALQAVPEQCVVELPFPSDILLPRIVSISPDLNFFDSPTSRSLWRTLRAVAADRPPSTQSLAL